MRKLLYDTLDPEVPTRGARIFRIVHHTAAMAGVAAMILETWPPAVAAPGAASALIGVFYAVVVLFSLEYVARFYSIVEAPWLHPTEPWKSRLHWAISPHGIIELIAVVPILATLELGWAESTAQFFSILWLLKLATYSHGFLVLVRVIRNAREQLVSVFFAFLMILLAAGTLQYLLEREAQPEAFGSIPSALWWTIVTLTTTGYGDAVPVTAAGRFLAGVVMVCGIAVFALWAGVLASSFGDEIRRREFLRTWDLVAKVPFFHDLDGGTIADLARLLRPREVKQGAVIVRRGQPGDCMYFVVDGEVEILIDPPVVLEAGSFFGEIALVTGAPRGATVVAVQETMLLVLDLVDFRDLLSRRPELSRAINEEASRRIGPRI